MILFVSSLTLPCFLYRVDSPRTNDNICKPSISKTSNPHNYLIDLEGDISIYFVDKITKQPPEVLDTSNLKTYAKQVTLTTCTGFKYFHYEFKTSFFDDNFHVSFVIKYGSPNETALFPRSSPPDYWLFDLSCSQF